MGGIERDAVLPARAIGSAMGLTFSVKTRRGCDGNCDPEKMEVCAHVRGPETTRNFLNAHEIEHFIRYLERFSWPHDEHRIDAAALALLLPREHVRAVVARIGWQNPRGIAEALPGVSPARAILRAAWVSWRPVTVHAHGERMAWAPEGWPLPERGTWWEQRLVREVRASGRWQRSTTLVNAFGFPLGETGADGVAVLLPSYAAIRGW